MRNKEFSKPLNERDTELQTYGCRHSNPEICKKNGLVGVCAFVRDDGICKSPTKAWPKQYMRLLGMKERDEPSQG